MILILKKLKLLNYLNKDEKEKLNRLAFKYEEDGVC